MVTPNVVKKRRERDLRVSKEEIEKERAVKEKPKPKEYTKEGQAELKTEFEASKRAAQIQAKQREAQLIQAEETIQRREQQEQRQKAGVEFLQEKEFFEEKRPERVELGEARGGEIGAQYAEETPVIGASFKAVSNLLGVRPRPELEPLIQDPQTARQLAMQEIQRKEIKTGLSKSEKFGAYIEAIPIAGSIVAKYAGQLIESPKENVDTIVSEIDSERERASVKAEKAFTGKIGDPYEAVALIEDIENNIAKMEQRIKLLSLSSAELIANADQLNKIEEKILRAKERVFVAKQAAAGGIVAPATDSNIFLTLEELKK